MSARFRKIEDRLPSTWTLLYKIACLDHNEFLRILPQINANMTEKDFRTVLGKPNNSIPLNVPDMTINLPTKCAARKREIYFELDKIAIKYKFKITMSKEFENDILNCNLKEVA
jgi:hypothetical protein